MEVAFRMGSDRGAMSMHWNQGHSVQIPQLFDPPSRSREFPHFKQNQMTIPKWPKSCASLSHMNTRHFSRSRKNTVKCYNPICRALLAHQTGHNSQPYMKLNSLIRGTKPINQLSCEWEQRWRPAWLKYPTLATVVGLKCEGGKSSKWKNVIDFKCSRNRIR